MAYAALVSLTQIIDHILNHHQYSNSLHKKQQIISLDKYAILLQAFLEDFPEEANSLEGRIRDVANDAEDIIECYLSEQFRSHYGLIQSSAAPEKEFRHQLKKVTEKIDSIAGKVMDIKNSFRIKDVGVSDFSAASSSSRVAPTREEAMVGFEDNLMEIKAQICGESPKLQVIPIYGMGGIGKTTLARNVYDDPLIMEHFEIRAWVTISQTYSAQEIFSGLLVSMKVLNADRSRRSNEMAEKVYKILKGRRYLIVLDDIWSTKAWDDIKMIFPNDDNGSRIILTTRLLDVAAYADSSSPLHEMRLMDVDQSWNLLRQKVFTNEDCPRELENIGKAIARSCRGLPLAIVVIAGLLSTVSQTRASWEEIAENINSAVATKDGQFEKILSLSYTHLSHHLRPCFLYMAGFPEDYEIYASKLIKLWIAEGFMKPSLSKSFEEGAEECLEDLVKRSLVLVTKRKSNGKIKSCRVHDLVRDLCIRKAQQEKFLLHVRRVVKSIKNQRRISVAYSNLNCPSNVYGSTIRTIICFQPRGILIGFFRNFRLLRVLVVLDVDIQFLPPEVFELIHLRCLAFYYPMDIPTAISNLQNLQTLIIHPRRKLTDYPRPVHLPLEIWRMPQLRHLVCYQFGRLPNPEGENFALENLQTLSAVTNLVCTERIGQMIPHLKKLGIICLRDIHDEDYHLDNLVYLHQLEKLKLKMSHHFPIRQKVNLAFPETLKKLTLSGWRLPWKDMTIVGSLPNLEVLKLRDSACIGDKWETIEGEFRQLKFLLIGKSDLQHWITENSHFPSLKCLLLHGCQYLSEIPDDIGEIPTLELIEVKYGKKSLEKSVKRIQKQQQSLGNDSLQIRCR